MNASSSRSTLLLAPLLVLAIKSVLVANTAAALPAAPPCESCHGAHGEGVPAAHVPRIAGQSSEYLLKQLNDFASGVRENPIMANIATSMSVADRAKFSSRYANLKAPYAAENPAPATKPAPTQLDRGHQLAFQGDESRGVQACNACHGPEGVGVEHAAPYLAGQSMDYLTGALKSFHDGTRKNDGGELMRSVATRLSEADIAAVSAYFASVRLD